MRQKPKHRAPKPVAGSAAGTSAAPSCGNAGLTKKPVVDRGKAGKRFSRSIQACGRYDLSGNDCEEKSQAMLIDMEGKLSRRTHALSERVKELDCLFTISKLFDEQDLPLAEILRRVNEVICKSWQYPDCACARIFLDNLVVATENFVATPWVLSVGISIYNGGRGVLEVGYTEEKPACDEGPFLSQEKKLLKMVAKNLGYIISRKLMEESLRDKALRLEEMNTALNTLLDKRQQDRDQFGSRFVENTKLLILPHLERLARMNRDAGQSALIATIRENLDEVASYFSHNLTSPCFNLSPAELRVANFVKQGKNSREISKILNISEKTVKNHRHNIRQKVDITNTKVNLRTFLLSIRE